MNAMKQCQLRVRLLSSLYITLVVFQEETKQEEVVSGGVGLLHNQQNVWAFLFSYEESKLFQPIKAGDSIMRNRLHSSGTTEWCLSPSIFNLPF
jgi:hypothetical protein